MLLLIPAITQVSQASEAECLAKIMWSEARGESVEGVIAVGHASINRSKVSKQKICNLKGVTRHQAPRAVKDSYIALAKSALSTKSVVGKADSWERGVVPHRAGSITRRIGKHVFYVMAGL
jgi:spore germination cell wall hydrolase CwlJ-like protein